MIFILLHASFLVAMTSFFTDPSFKQVADQLCDAIIITNTDGNITWANKGFESLCGYSPKYAIGHNPGKMLQGKYTNPLATVAMHQAIANATFIEIDVVNYHKNGTPYWACVSINPIKDEADQLIGFVGITKDITQHTNFISYAK